MRARSCGGAPGVRAYSEGCRCGGCRAAKTAADRRHAERKRAGLVEPAGLAPWRPDPLLAGFVARFGGLPRLPGAACVGRWGLFDPRGEGEDRADAARRHVAALRICGACPARTPCASWASGQPANQLGGVVGGAIHDE